MFRLIILIFLTIFSIMSNVFAWQTEVFVSNVENKIIVDELESVGTLKSSESVDLESTVTELVTKVNFVSGQYVKKGDILVEMDIEEELALKAEEISILEEAKRQINRLKPLVKIGASSEVKLDGYKLDYNTAKARIRVIDSQIKQRKIIAPFDGKLGMKNISVGSLLQVGELITTIDDFNNMKLDFSVPEVFISSLKIGTEIEAKSKIWPGKIFKGKIENINSRINSNTRSISMRAILENKDNLLLPGMFLNVKLKKNPRQALVVPEESIMLYGKKHSVFSVEKQEDKNIARSKIIKIGNRQKGYVEIIEGLEEGAQIVADGALKLYDGALISIKAIKTDDALLSNMLHTKTQN